MAASNYETCLKHVLRHEGGYVNHPSDPGGETNFGITVAVARENGYAGPMKSIPMNTVKRIYRARYWDALRCDDLPAGVDYAVFDYGVNSGIGRSAKVLQRTLGIPDDGRVGPETIDAVNKCDAFDLVERLCDERLAFLKRLVTWPTFGKGWARRVAEVRRDAGMMVVKGVPLPPDIEPTKPQKHWLAALIEMILALFRRT